MIGVMVTLTANGEFDAGVLEKIAKEAQDIFGGMPNLRSKAMTVDEGRSRARNFYIWESEDAARDFFNDEMIEFVTGLYGVPPTVEFVDVLTLIDNAH